MRSHGVRCLLMGGQACVFYGAAEFSRDLDLAVLPAPENLDRFRAALRDLQATVIAVPPFEPSHLHAGLAIHFRCQAPGVENFRIDIMAVMRGVDPFPALWERRTTIDIDGQKIDLLSLPDLIAAKKTQRAKDWPMVQRLIEAHWFQNRHEPTPERIDFWLRECISPELLIEIAAKFPTQSTALQATRPTLTAARASDLKATEQAIDQERQTQEDADKSYWLPLRQQLETLRHQDRTP